VNYRDLLITLGFSPKEDTVDVLVKKYQQAASYSVEVNIEKQVISYGNRILSDPAGHGTSGRLDNLRNP
jgi:hypothetical protein